jgi:hypothetical protein
MEENEASNGHDAKPQKSPPASGANKGSKKRRKVNHGKLRVTANSDYSL